MESVERAIRSTFSSPVTLHAVGQHKPFVLDEIDRRGIVLLLGTKQAHTRLSWECLEDVVPFLGANAVGYRRAGTTASRASPAPSTSTLSTTSNAMSRGGSASSYATLALSGSTKDRP